MSLFDIERILFGAVDRELHSEGTTIHITAPYRFRWEERGVYVLIRTPQGYFSLNPTKGPIALDAWPDLEPGLVRPAPDPDRTLYEKKTDHQIYQFYTPGHWYGTSVFLSSGEVSIELHEEGKCVIYRAWDRQGGLRRVARADEGRNGYSLVYGASHLLQYEHFRQGEREGTERKYFSNGRIWEEIYWHESLRHGTSPEWARDGTLSSEVLYEHSFIAPVIRFQGPPRGFKIYKSRFGVSYSGSVDLIDQFEVGMSLEDVSDILRLDFSQGTGLHFKFYSYDMFLHVSFESGLVSAIHTGWNGLDYERR